MKKLTLASFALLFTFSFAFQVQAAATVLPEAGDPAYCAAIFEYGDPVLIREQFQADADNWDSLLGCAIKYGEIEFWMLPYFISFILRFLIGLSGVIAVLMILLGAYFYIASGISEDKEKGKNLIKYAILGLVLALSSWFIVNLILLALTS